MILFSAMQNLGKETLFVCCIWINAHKSPKLEKNNEGENQNCALMR